MIIQYGSCFVGGPRLRKQRTSRTVYDDGTGLCKRRGRVVAGAAIRTLQAAKIDRRGPKQDFASTLSGVGEHGTGLYKRNLHPDRDSPSRDPWSINSNEQRVSSVIHRTLQAHSILSKKRNLPIGLCLQSPTPCCRYIVGACRVPIITNKRLVDAKCLQSPVRHTSVDVPGFY
jgi:hypothetical protein